MKVYVVGSSCTWFTRNNTSFILDDTMLFDVPSGAYKFIINKIDFFSIKSVFISHFHSDHFGDLQVVVTRFMRESEKNGVKHKLKVYGPKGTLDQLIKYNKVIFAAEDEYDRKSLTKNVDFIEVGDGDTFEENGYNVKVFKMNHGKVYCQGYSFTDKEGKTVSFSGDTVPCEGLEKMLSFSNFAFIDAASEKNVHHIFALMNL